MSKNYIETISDEFKNAYSINPKKTLRIMKLCMAELGCDVDNEFLNKHGKVLFNENKQLTILFIILAILGIFSLQGMGIYYFGFLFFLCGFLAATANDGFKGNLIFLFSHGGTGLVAMFGSILFFSYKSYLSNKLLFILLGVAIGFCFAGLLKCIIYSLSNSYGKVFYAKSRSLLLFFIGFVILFVSKFLILLGVV